MRVGGSGIGDGKQGHILFRAQPDGGVPRRIGSGMREYFSAGPSPSSADPAESVSRFS